MKGSRWTPVDVNATEQVGEIVYQESRAFEERAPDSYFLHITLTYRKNKKNYSGLWSLQVLNTLGAKNYTSYEYNLKTNTIEKDYETIIVPNLSYKIQF